MRILLVSGVYPPQIGGPSAQTQCLAQELLKRGIATQVVTFGETKTTTTVVDGVTVTYLDGSDRRSLGDKLVKNWRVYRDLCTIMRDFQPTVVHQQTAVANLAIYTGLAARRCGIPSLLKYSSDLIWERLNRGSGTGSQFSQFSRLRLLQQQRFLFSLYDCLWVTTPAFQERLQQEFQIASPKIFLLPNFIDLGRFEQVADAHSQTVPPSEPVILTVTRLQPWKGVDICIQALIQLQDLSCKLRIVGEGPPDYVTALNQQVQHASLEARVEFLGRIPPDQIQEQYAQADVFILASTYEPFGIVLVEAMAAGVPVVASRVDGIPSVVDDSGILVTPKDAMALAEALRLMLMDTQLRSKLVERGRQRAGTFGLEVGCDRMLDCYRQLQSIQP